MKAELHNFQYWVNHHESDHLKSTLQKALEHADFEILGFMEHHFSPQGYTSIWLLGESHLALHTFPEESKSYIELTSCSLSKADLFKLEVTRELG